VYRINRRVKWSLLMAIGIVLGVLAAAAVGSAFSSRSNGVTTRVVRFNSSLDSAGSKTLWEDAQFRIVGKCMDLGGGVFRAQPVIKTKDDHAAFDSVDGDANDQDWNKADGLKKILSDPHAAQGTSAAPDFAPHATDGYFGAIRKNGDEVLHGFAWSAAFHGPKCRWGGYLTRVVAS